MRINKILTGAAAAWLLAGMMTPGVAASDYELRNRLEMLERDVQTMRAASSGPAGEAKLGVRISELEEQVRLLRGMVEENQYRNDQLAKQLKTLSDDTRYRLQTLESNAPLEGMPPAPGAQPAAAVPPPPPPPATTPQGRSMQDVVNEVAGDVKPVPPAAPVTLPAMQFGSPQEHYSHAFTLINRAQYDEAEQVLQSFVQKYPGDALTGNAYYWLGETYYVREKYVEAADAFRQGFESMPNGQKAPDNLLKLGMSLSKLGKKDQACVVLKQLPVKYAGKAQPVLDRAARESQSLGCH